LGLHNLLPSECLYCQNLSRNTRARRKADTEQWRCTGVWDKVQKFLAPFRTDISSSKAVFPMVRTSSSSHSVPGSGSRESFSDCPSINF
jgi:hypothetical protein